MIKIAESSKAEVSDLRDEYEKHIIIKVRDDNNTIYDLINYIRKISGIGHSFNVVVDPGDSDYEQKFFIDGDGTDTIYGIATNEYKDIM